MSLTPEQKLERKDGLGASDAAPALGLSPWKSALALHLEKTGQAQPSEEETEAMRFGTLLEPVIRGEYSRRKGVDVISGQKMLRSLDYPWMTANLDGWVPATARVLEAKTARWADGWGEPGTDDVPQAYLIQVVHQMIVTGAQVADIAVLIGGSDFRIYTVPLRRELAELVIEGERIFWDGVQQRRPPTPRTLEDMKLAYPTGYAIEKEAPPDIVEALQNYRNQKRIVKHCEDIRDEYEAQIKAFLADADTLTITGIPVATWKTQSGRAEHVVKAGKPFRVFRLKNTEEK